MRAQEVLERHRGELLRIPGVVGIGLGREDGEVIELLLERPVDGLPDSLEGIPVRVRVVGRIEADGDRRAS